MKPAAKQSKAIAGEAVAAPAPASSPVGNNRPRRGRRLLVAGAVGALGAILEAACGKSAPVYDAGLQQDSSPEGPPAAPGPDAGAGDGG